MYQLVKLHGKYMIFKTDVNFEVLKLFIHFRYQAYEFFMRSFSDKSYLLCYILLTCS